MAEKLKKKEVRLETDGEYYGRQRLRDLKLPVQRDENGKRMPEESDEAALRRIGLEKYVDLVAINPETEKVYQLGAKDLIEKTHGKVLIKIKDPKTGEMRLETEADLNKRISDGLGVKIDLGRNSAYEMADKATGFRDAREARGAAFASFANKDFILNKAHSDPESLIPLAKSLSWGLFKLVLDLHEIERDIKIQMWQVRRGKLAGMIAEIQAKVDSGEIVEFGPEYAQLSLRPYQEQTTLMRDSGEYQEFLRWEVPILDKNGKPYTKKMNSSGTGFRVERGGGGETLTQENLKQVVAWWIGTSSTQCIEATKPLDENEARNIKRRKRKGLSNLRDAWAGIQIIFGETAENEFALPVSNNSTAEYDAVKRARDFAAREVADMQLVINENIAPPEDILAAKDRLKFALMVLEGPKEFDELKGLSPKDRDKKIRDARTELCALSPAKRRQRINSSNFYYVLNKLILIEGGYPENAMHPTGIPDWHEGKNPEEEKGLLGKKEFWSPPLVFGLDYDRLKALVGDSHVDLSEKKALFRLVLVYREMKFIMGCATTDGLTDMLPWPDNDALIDRIQEERSRRFGEENPSLTEVLKKQKS